MRNYVQWMKNSTVENNILMLKELNNKMEKLQERIIKLEAVAKNSKQHTRTKSTSGATRIGLIQRSNRFRK